MLYAQGQMISQPGSDDKGTCRIFCAASLLLFLGAGWLAGCGTPAAPLAPTLKLPEPVRDLSATRSEGTVHLKWTMPRRSTDNILLEGKAGVYVWRTPGNGKGELVGDVRLPPGVAAEFADRLPPQLQHGSPTPITYRVELLNHLARSAGLSNTAYSAAGTPPDAVQDLSFEMTRHGVHLHWRQDATDQPSGMLRIHRKLMSALPSGKSKNLNPEPLMQTLLVKSKAGRDPGEALDPGALFGRHYEYWVERVALVSLEGHSFEILGAPSKALLVETQDVFPPQAPQQLAAVAVESQHAIDLSWTPNTEPDLAGYVVYRSEAGSKPERVSAADTVLIAPAYRDRSALPGHRYRYSVSALDTSGNESPHSAEAEELLPQPPPK